MEKGAELELAVKGGEKLSGGTLQVYLDEKLYREHKIPTVAAGEDYRVRIPVDTALRAGEYSIKTVLNTSGDTPYIINRRFNYTIVPRPLPNRMPVIMWGSPLGREWQRYASPDEKKNLVVEIERLKYLGFNHCFLVDWTKLVNYKEIFQKGTPVNATPAPELSSILDAALENDFKFSLVAYPGYAVRYEKDLAGQIGRIGRDGTLYSAKDAKSRDVCGILPAVQKYHYNVGVSVGNTYGGFPALDGVLINSELRDQTVPCFHEEDKQAFRKYSGLDIPAEVQSKRGVPYKEIKGFDTLRTVDDRDPVYLYYKWFWKQGDGWNSAQSSVAEGIRSAGHSNLWTWYDPAVRVPSVYGSGGSVDYISNWSYTTPEPMHPAMSTDSLIAMSKGSSNPNQQVMAMTQIIWRRHQSAPVKGETSKTLAPWEADHDKATFITIAPMHLKEAFWAIMSRPVKGIMYHGWGSLVPVDSKGYVFTNPNTQHVLSRLVHGVVEPLGPTLVQVPGVKSDVAYLQSLASEAFAGRGTYGWGGNWGNDSYSILQYAQLQPEIVFDETVTEHGLDGYKVLAMFDCDVITKKTAERVKAFQSAGGIVIGDENLSPAVKPDILVKRHARGAALAKEDREYLLSAAAALRRDLDAHYSRYLESSNPSVITYRRRAGKADYLFAFNDNREYGTYVGQYKMVMEDGVPSDAQVTLARKSGYVYDLTAGQRVGDAKVTDGKISIPVHLGPCDGRVFMVTEQEIRKVSISMPEGVRAGESAECRITVADESGRPVEAVVPVRVDITDPEGAQMELSGYWGAAGGQLAVKLEPAKNDRTG